MDRHSFYFSQSSSMGRKINLIARTLQKMRSRHFQVAPEGFFSVFVGSDKQRFVVSTTCLNHPLFKVLLEDAESEFGFGSVDGPLVLPCHVDLFYRVLAEMEPCGGGDDDDDLMTSGCSPVRLRSCRSGSYSALAAPSRMFKIN